MPPAAGQQSAIRPGPRLYAAPGRDLFVPAVTVACAALLWAAWRVRDELYLRAEEGLGYALGIVGLSCMVLLLLYSLRKRTRLVRGPGALRHWFRAHMVLGIVGPTAILLHSNFNLGSRNSTAALVSMLLVAGSGYVGRFIYARIHRGLFGERRQLNELRSEAEVGFGAAEGLLRLDPALQTRFDAFEDAALTPPAGLVGAMLRLSRAGSRARALRRASRLSLDGSDHPNPWVLEAAFEEYVAAALRVARFSLYERLFSLWHAVHLPLAFILFGAAAVHVLAVHMF